jgi:hypothetical protein
MAMTDAIDILTGIGGMANGLQQPILHNNPLKQRMLM